MLSREAFLAAPLSELVGYWLDIRCSCGSAVKYPLRLLARERGGGLPASSALARLRCRRCGQRPVSVAAIDDPSAGTPGGPAEGWRLELELT